MRACICHLPKQSHKRIIVENRMKQPKLLPGKKRKLTAYEVRKLTRRRHITWQRLGREYNTHFPYEKSGELPGAGDRIVPNAKDLVESYFNEQDEMNNNAIMENEYYDSNNYDKNNEKYNNVNNQTINHLLFYFLVAHYIF